jgi:hypothetical protein
MQDLSSTVFDLTNRVCCDAVWPIGICLERVHFLTHPRVSSSSRLHPERSAQRVPTRSCPSGSAPEGGYLAYACTTQLMWDRHAEGMPAKSPTIHHYTGSALARPWYWRNKPDFSALCARPGCMRTQGETPMKVLMTQRFLATRSHASKPCVSVRERAGTRLTSRPVMPGGTGRRTRGQNFFGFTYFQGPSTARPLGWPLRKQCR